MDSLPVSMRHVATGAGLVALGAILTGGGFIWATLHEGGGAYFIFTGLFLWGGIRAVQGLIELPNYLAAKRSGDPWLIARHFPARLGQMVPHGVTHSDPSVRIKALDQLPFMVKSFPVVQLAPLFAAGLADPVEGVRDRAYRNVLFVAQSDRRAGIGVVTAVLAVFRNHEELIERVPGGRETLNRFLGVTIDPKRYVQWIQSGFLPESAK